MDSFLKNTMSPAKNADRGESGLKKKASSKTGLFLPIKLDSGELGDGCELLESKVEDNRFGMLP